MERRKERDSQKKRHDVERKKAKEAKEAERKRSAQQDYNSARQINPTSSDGNSKRKCEGETAEAASDPKRSRSELGE